MADKIVIPREGQGMESALIIEWFVKVGDEVSFGDELCDVESEKASFPIEAAVTGTVLAICYEAGDTAPVLETIAVVGKPGENFEHLLSKTTEPVDADVQVVTPVQPPQQQQAIGSDLERRRISPRAKRLAENHSIDLDAISADPIRERDVVAYIDGKTAITPAAADYAKETGISIPAEGSGIGGRVKVEDITARGEESQTIPLTNMRRIIAEKMYTSVQSTAQFTLHSFADVTKVLQYHRRVKESAFITTRITLNDLFLFVTAQTLSEHRDLR